MAKTLDVYLHDELVGHLIQDEGGQTVFEYTQAWLDRPAATALSVSLPLRKEHFSRNECRRFFAGILPDETKREIIASNLGISARWNESAGSAPAPSRSLRLASRCLCATITTERFLRSS